jgi:hypothetical protein
VNYFIDSDHLEIEEKNLFTATELATIIPLYGKEYYVALQNANPWVFSLFPNYSLLPSEEVAFSKRSFIKKTLESLLNVLAADRMESFFRNLTLRRWNRLYRDKFADNDFDVAFKTKNYASKNHPNHYQRKVEDLYIQKINAFQVKLESTWTYD